MGSKLKELCTLPMDIMGPAKIPENARPIGRPDTIENRREMARSSDFDEVYGDMIDLLAPEGANAYIIGIGNVFHAIQYYKI